MAETEGSLSHGDGAISLEVRQYFWLSVSQNEGSLHQGDINTS